MSGNLRLGIARWCAALALVLCVPRLFAVDSGGGEVACFDDIEVFAPFGQEGAVVYFTQRPQTPPEPPADLECLPASGSVFPIGITTVNCWSDGDGDVGIGSAAAPGTCQFTVTVLPQENIVWPRALPIPLVDQLGVLEGSFRMPLMNLDESRWFRFTIQPGSRVVVTLTDLPANYDLVLFRDIRLAYQQLTDPSDLPLLDAEFADDALSPAQFSPAQFSPAQFSPAAFSPAQFSPAQFSPAQFSPAQFSPAQFSPAQFSPDAYAPAQFSPAQFSPAQFSPAQFSPAQFSPAQFSPAQFSEEAYASAQTRSVIANSAYDGTSPEGVVANTWNDDTEYFVRVRGRQGAFDPTRSFTLNVYVYTGVCADLSSTPVDAGGVALPPSTFRAPAGGYRTLVLTDYDALVGPGASPARTALEAKLAELAARPEVSGYVLDVGQDPWVRFFRQQALANVACAYGMNLLAEAIRDIVQRSREGNALEYLVLIGNDAVIPYFRQPDQAMLGPEQDFVPPVYEFSASQASLRGNFFLTQDAYGARRSIVRKGIELPLPDLAVGRLLETPTEIARMIDTYLGNPGGLRAAPSSILVTGYDFLEDAAEAVAAEWQAGAGIVPERLITPRELPPTDPESWTADDLRAALFGRRHDILYLAGHFSAAGALAADYTTRLLASELLSAPDTFANTILYSAGCHSGYNIVDADAIPAVTLQPDWSQVAARLGMTLIGGTGYQYGDTDFLEYSERLYLFFTRQLRTGTGPVSLGRALVRAKQQYLATTADLRGIHEKALYQATLFGLPMLALDLPGSRLPEPTLPSVIGSTRGYTARPTGFATPGEVLQLRYADLTVIPSLTAHTMQLRDAEADPNQPREVTVKWYSGTDGVVSQPAEPVLPLEIRNVGVPGLYLRGIGFRGGTYLDEPGVTPLTGAATTEIRGVHPTFLSDVFFPSKFWRANYYDLLTDETGGITRLMVTPAQYRSYPADETGVLRRFDRADFRLFYSANIGTYTQDSNNDGTIDTAATPALSAPPQIANISARSENGSIRFRVQVVGNPAAGIQEVWVTFTAVSGPLIGRWTTLDLIQDPADSRRWTGTLPLGGIPATDYRFLVQAVNGVGLVALASNLGAFFVPDRTDPPTTPPAPTQVQWIAPPAQGIHGASLPVSARLLANGTPLAGQPMDFRLGGLQARALTDADGIASLSLYLSLTPADYPLSAVFPGSTVHASSRAEVPFSVRKSPTRLALDPDPAIIRPDGDASLFATLTDDSGRPLAEQAVVFVVDAPGSTLTVVAITDFNGRAALGRVDLQPGSYPVTATFGEQVNRPPPFVPVGDASSRYEPSSDTATLVLDASVPTASGDEVTARAGATLKLAIASILANDTDPAGSTLSLLSTDATTGRGTAIQRSGAWLLLNTLPVGVRSDAFYYTVANPAGKSATARVILRLVTDEAPTSNLLETTVVPDGIRLRFAGIPGRTYRIQFSSALEPPDWITVGSATVGPDGLASFDAPTPVGGSGFYRTAYP